MRTLRLKPDLAQKRKLAASQRGESVSEFIRRAIEDLADKTLVESGNDRFSDVAGVVHGGGSSARQSEAAFSLGLKDDKSER